MCILASSLAISASVSMQFPMSQVATSLFLREFYSTLVQGVSVDTAMSRTRRAIANQLQRSEWAAPVLFAHATTGVLFQPVRGYRANPKTGRV
jgi:hypothetical protein